MPACSSLAPSHARWVAKTVKKTASVEETGCGAETMKELLKATKIIPSSLRSAIIPGRLWGLYGEPRVTSGSAICVHGMCPVHHTVALATPT